MRIVSWNVNGLRSVAKKGFFDWLSAESAFVVGLQETRAQLAQLEPELQNPLGYHGHFASGERAGYSGVGLLAQRAPDSVVTSLGRSDLDAEGRFILGRWGRLCVVNCYFPNGSGKERDNGRVPFKLDFYRHLFETLEAERTAGGRVLVMGDYNTAHQPIDLARPKQNTNTSGFLQEERDEFARWLRAGWVDTFRHFEKGEGHYTWWSQRFGVREKNIGWRIDYVLASEGAMPFVRRAGIDPHVRGSDHCPVFVEIDPAIID